ncbi:MAG: polysaccharide export protein [Gammaproteobacteria bacterium]|nr:polysaccharide export protein [Gammaproteobacteria bacterium]
MRFAVTFRLFPAFAWAVFLTLFFVCTQLPAQTPAVSSGASDSAYQLDSGDVVRISVFNQPDISGDYMLDGDGRFSMPLIGAIEAAGLTPAELEARLVDLYRPDYLVNPRIFIQVMNYRPYYLIGEVRGTGPFPYQAGMTYLTAIANAGGFTYRAKKDHVIVIRADDPAQQEIRLDVEERVQPGDIIRVEERLF